MRRPHLSILIGDCVCSHGQLDTGKALVCGAAQELGVRGKSGRCCNLCMVINERRAASQIFHVYDMMNAGPSLGLIVEMLREMNNKVL